MFKKNVLHVVVSEVLAVCLFILFVPLQSMFKCNLPEQNFYYNFIETVIHFFWYPKSYNFGWFSWMIFLFDYLLKVPVPKSLETEFSLNWQIWLLFLPIHHPWWKNANLYLTCKQLKKKQCLCYLLFYKWWKLRFIISKRVFRWFS